MISTENDEGLSSGEDEGCQELNNATMTMNPAHDNKEDIYACNVAHPYHISQTDESAKSNITYVKNTHHTTSEKETMLEYEQNRRPLQYDNVLNSTAIESNGNTLAITVTNKGGMLKEKLCGRDELFITVPEGAVDDPVSVAITTNNISDDTHHLPEYANKKGVVINLEPHNFHFREHILIKFKVQSKDALLLYSNTSSEETYDWVLCEDDYCHAKKHNVEDNR